MPWKASSVMEERLRFVARLLDGETMTDVCRQFGISRKTGYKIFDRYRDHGLEALTDRSRRPVRYANQLPPPIESLIVRLKDEKPHWGARKIRELLVRRLAGDVRIPARSTIHAVLDRHGLVRRSGGPRHRARGTPLSEGAAINKLDKYQLLILDDIAYVTKDQAETSVLFELIAARYERRSLLITANQPFGEWGKIFTDKTMTLAAIDRLVHHATIVEMNVESYRRKAALKRKHGKGD
jgi:transposase